MQSTAMKALGYAMLLGGLCGVATASYLLGKRQAEKELEGVLDAELDSIRKRYARLSKQDEYADLSKVVAESHKDRRSETVAPVQKEEDPSEKYAFFDYRREIPKRDPKIAYVISWDEFNENPKDYDQRTLTYFAKDDVLVEERDAPIEDILSLLGPVALDQFGNGSRDPNIVYVRNDNISMDFEVCLDQDSFEETVLGHIKHGDSRKVRKFRLDDD